MTDKEHFLKCHTNNLSELLTALNAMTLFSDRLKDVDLTKEYRLEYNIAVEEMQSIAFKLLKTYESETGQYVNFMEGWGFRSEWEKEFNNVQS